MPAFKRGIVHREVFAAVNRGQRELRATLQSRLLNLAGAAVGQTGYFRLVFHQPVPQHTVEFDRQCQQFATRGI